MTNYELTTNDEMANKEKTLFNVIFKQTVKNRVLTN